MDRELQTFVYLLLFCCFHCSAVRDLTHPGHQVSMPLDEPYGIQCTLLPPSYNTSCLIRQALASDKEKIKASFAEIIRRAADDAISGTRTSKVAIFEASAYTSQIVKALNETAIRVVAHEGDAICSTVFDDALAISYDFAKIFVEVLDEASDRISFAWPCDAINTIASASLGVFSDMLSIVCNNPRMHLDELVDTLVSMLVTDHSEVINAALKLAVPGGPVGQLTVWNTGIRLKAAITTDTMIPVPMTE